MYKYKVTFYLICLTLLLLGVPNSVLAQNSGSTTLSQDLAMQKKVDDFVSKLTEGEINALARARIQEMLNSSATNIQNVQDTKVGFSESFRLGWQNYTEFLANNVTEIPNLIANSLQIFTVIFKDRSLVDNVLFLVLVIAMLAIGSAAELFVKKITRNWRDNITSADGEDLVAMLSILGKRLVVELMGLAVFAVATLVTARVLFADPVDNFLASSFVILAILIVRLLAAFLRFTLDPNKTSLRLVSTDDWTARFIYSNFLRMTGILGVGFYLLGLMNKFEIEGGLILRFWAGVYLSVSIVYVTWRARKGLTSIIKGQGENLTPGLERMARWWPLISIVVMLFQYIVTQFALSSGAFEISPTASIITLAIIVLLPFVDTMVRGIIKYMVPPMQGEGAVAEDAYYQTLHSFSRIGRVLLVSLLILGIGLIWGINLQNLAKSGFGAQLAANLIGSMMVLAIGYLIWEAANLWINQQLAKDIPAITDVGTGKSRMATVLPLIKMTLQITIITITVLLALSRLGINITPLLAGVGVLGLAVGFGAQTLVKDIVSGVFFLLDDAFRVGEFIDIGGTVGTVEKISLRSLQLRHINGPVHIVPYGEIPKLTNHSRDYVIMKLRFTVPFDTDIDKVRKLFKKIGAQMMEVPELAENFIEPFKSQGAVEVNDVGIVLSGKFMTKPGTQWVVRKEVYSRVQKAFDENDIDFARKEVRVQIPGLEFNAALDKKQKTAIKLAAGSAAGDEENSKTNQ